MRDAASDRPAFWRAAARRVVRECRRAWSDLSNRSRTAALSALDVDPEDLFLMHVLRHNAPAVRAALTAHPEWAHLTKRLSRTPDTTPTNALGTALGTLSSQPTDQELDVVAALLEAGADPLQSVPTATLTRDRSDVPMWSVGRAAPAPAGWYVIGSNDPDSAAPAHTTTPFDTVLVNLSMALRRAAATDTGAVALDTARAAHDRAFDRPEFRVWEAVVVDAVDAIARHHGPDPFAAITAHCAYWPLMEIVAPQVVVALRAAWERRALAAAALGSGGGRATRRRL